MLSRKARRLARRRLCYLGIVFRLMSTAAAQPSYFGKWSLIATARP